MDPFPANEGPPAEIDTSRPCVARIYDYALGGKNHFEADREIARLAERFMPFGRTAARENRAFLGRAVRYLAAEAGIRQFLDIGAGLPTTNNVHEVAQAVAPESHVLYADKDPMVIAHARALLTSSPQGRTAYLHADLRDPDAILSHKATTDVLDFGRPIGLILMAVLHFIPDADNPKAVIKTLLDALPPGSYLAASHASAEHGSRNLEEVTCAFEAGGIRGQTRDSDEFARLAFGGLELVPPGVVAVSDWRPVGMGPRPAPAEVNFYGGVARKP